METNQVVHEAMRRVSKDVRKPEVVRKGLVKLRKVTQKDIKSITNCLLILKVLNNGITISK